MADEKKVATLDEKCDAITKAMLAGMAKHDPDEYARRELEKEKRGLEAVEQLRAARRKAGEKKD